MLKKNAKLRTEINKQNDWRRICMMGRNGGKGKMVLKELAEKEEY